MPEYDRMIVVEFQENFPEPAARAGGGDRRNPDLKFLQKFVQLSLSITLHQWFLTLLEVLNPTSFIHAIFRILLSWKNQMCDVNFIYFIYIAQNLLLPNP